MQKRLDSKSRVQSLWKKSVGRRTRKTWRKRREGRKVESVCATVLASSEFSSRGR